MEKVRNLLGGFDFHGKSFAKRIEDAFLSSVI